MYSKADIFNLTLGALLLSRQITDTETETSNEARVLRTHYNSAFATALQDMDLDSTASQVDLALIEEDPNELWKYAYRYPTDCAFFRRLQSCVITDDRTTHILKQIRMHEGEKAILTNEENAIAEYISTSVPIGSLSPAAGLAVAYRLAIMSAPLVTGKGAAALIKSLEEKYAKIKAEAQSYDKQENFKYNPEWVDSEFVRARIE